MRMKTTLKLPGSDTCLIADVLFIEGKSNYSIIYLKGKSPITMAKTLKKFESQLRLHPFLRIHKSYLINQANLSEKGINDENMIQLCDGTHLPVSRRKREIIKQSL
jgi:two-component system LytT family response regulator